MTTYFTDMCIAYNIPQDIENIIFQNYIMQCIYKDITIYYKNNAKCYGNENYSCDAFRGAMATLQLTAAAMRMFGDYENGFINMH